MADGCTDFYRRCVPLLEKDSKVTKTIRKRVKKEGEEYTLTEYILEEGWEKVARMFRSGIGKEAPLSARAQFSQQSVQLSLISHMSHSKRLRKLARANPVYLEKAWELYEAMLGDNEYITKMLRVLDDEPALILHPGEKKGFEVRISGIAVNFELNLQIMKNLIGEERDGWLAGDAIDPDIMNYDKTFTGRYNLWNWPGLLPDRTVPEDGWGRKERIEREAPERQSPLVGRTSQDWIWNEGVPDDILLFEGRRVILLGPPPYSRSFNGGRMFRDMEPEFVIEKKLGPQEVDSWLNRIAEDIGSRDS
jgi:hypothetical protein